MAKSVFTCFEILKPTMNKWAQYPAQMEAYRNNWQSTSYNLSFLNFEFYSMS